MKNLAGSSYSRLQNPSDIAPCDRPSCAANFFRRGFAAATAFVIACFDLRESCHRIPFAVQHWFLFSLVEELGNEEGVGLCNVFFGALVLLISCRTHPVSEIILAVCAVLSTAAMGVIAWMVGGCDDNLQVGKRRGKKKRRRRSERIVWGGGIATVGTAMMDRRAAAFILSFRRLVT